MTFPLPDLAVVAPEIFLLAATCTVLLVDLFPPTPRDPHGVHRAIWDEYEDEDVPFEFPPGKDRTLASYDAGREKAAYVEPVAVGDAMPDMPLYLAEGYYVRVPLEAAYQTTWSVLPADLQHLVLTGRDTQTLPVSITSFLTFQGIQWGALTAAATLIMLPMIVLGVLVQGQVVRGMTLGSVKG